MDDSGRVSTSPPVPRRKENPVVHSAMSLRSLLKKEVQDRAHIGIKGSSPEGKGHVEVPKTKGFLASALADSSRLLVPIGLEDFSTEVGTSAKGEKTVLTKHRSSVIQHAVGICRYISVFYVAFIFIYEWICVWGDIDLFPSVCINVVAHARDERRGKVQKGRPGT